MASRKNFPSKRIFRLRTALQRMTASKCANFHNDGTPNGSYAASGRWERDFTRTKEHIVKLGGTV